MSADGELPGMWEESDLSGGWADTDGMSAKERLIRSVYQKLSQNQMEKLVDAFAHELAERLHEPLTHEESLLVQAHTPLRDILARRIDPVEEDDRG